MGAQQPASRRSAAGRAGVAGCLVLPAAVLILGWITSAAWACVPQPRLVVITPQASGPAGSQVTVQGIGFDPAPSRTEIRWNTAEGAVLGRAESADFSVTVTVPEAAPGSYGVLVLSRGADGVLGNTARASFEVRSDDAASPAPVTAPPSSPGPTFAPAPTVITRDSGTTGLTLVLAGVAVLAVGVFIGTLVRPKPAAKESRP